MKTERSTEVLSGNPDAIRANGSDDAEDRPTPQGEPPEPIMQYFEYAHLPLHLQAVSRSFCELAAEIVNTLPRNPERTVALRKLLESKDAGVRAKLAKPSTVPTSRPPVDPSERSSGYVQPVG